MLDSILTDEQKLFGQMPRGFGKREIGPRLKEYAAKKEYPAELGSKLS